MHKIMYGIVSKADFFCDLPWSRTIFDQWKDIWMKTGCRQQISQTFFFFNFYFVDNRILQKVDGNFANANLWEIFISLFTWQTKNNRSDWSEK